VVDGGIEVDIDDDVDDEVIIKTDSSIIKALGGSLEQAMKIINHNKDILRDGGDFTGK
jgi:hypothetical protein